MKRFILLLILSVYFFPLQVVSGNEYSVTRIIVSSTEKADEFNHLRYDVRDIESNLLYSVDKFIPYDLPFPSAAMFDDGSLILMRAFDSGIEFYNNKGDKEWEKYLLDRASPEWERTIHYDVGTNNIALMVSDVSMRFCPVFIFNKAGEKINEYNLARESAGGLAFSPLEDFLLISSGMWAEHEYIEETFILDSNFNLINTFNLSFRTGDFSGDGKYFVGFNGRKGFQIDLLNKNLTWEKAGQKGEIIIGCRFMEEKIAFISIINTELFTDKLRIEKLRFELLDKNGKTEINEIREIEPASKLDPERLLTEYFR